MKQNDKTQLDPSKLFGFAQAAKINAQASVEQFSKIGELPPSTPKEQVVQKKSASNAQMTSELTTDFFSKIGVEHR